MNFNDRIKLFGMQNLILENDLADIEQNGIEIGHSKTVEERGVIDIEIFETDIRKQAKQMVDLYYLLFCLENSIRKLIAERLKVKY